MTSPLRRDGPDFLFTFRAMACPCDVRVETDDEDIAAEVGRIAEAEARRIETKFSRYLPDNVIGRINASEGASVEVDAETAELFDFAASCFELSDGLFDITSGVLRRVWTFDGSDRVPGDAKIEALLPRIGWRKVSWQRPVIRLPAGMEIDLGGIGKEYAVDRALALVTQAMDAPVIVNFGGDLRVSGPGRRGAPWKVAIESVQESGRAAAILEVSGGAIATSGDARRYLLKDGVRYGHILDPRSGRPVMDAPRSVTVAAATCLEAGMMATLAMLNGRDAEAFLKRERIKAWCTR